MKKTKELRF